MWYRLTLFLFLLLIAPSDWSSVQHLICMGFNPKVTLKKMFLFFLSAMSDIASLKDNSYC